MKKSQAKSLFIVFLIFALLSILVYAVSTTLLVPVDNFSDDDGYLDLRGSCEPKSENDYDGTTSWNVTTATLYSNVDGTWKSNKTINLTGAELIANSTYFFNFTNVINRTNEGEFQWNILCQETNASVGIEIQTAFAGNNTIRVKYAQAIVESTSPVNNFHDLDGDNLEVVCTGTAFTNWNISKVELMTLDSNSNWLANQTFRPVLGVGTGPVVVNFTLGNYSDGTALTWSCSYTQILNFTFVGSNDSVISEKSSGNRTYNIEFPPVITLNAPADNNWSRNRQVKINYTVTTTHGTTALFPFPSRIWTNQSNGDWLPQTGSINADNNTDVGQPYTFPEQTAIIWGIQAFDANSADVFNFSVNRTINIDTIAPVITITTADLTLFDDTVEFEFSVTDVNIDTVTVFTNLNGLDFAANATINDAISGESITVTFNGSIDGRYNISVTVNDSATTEVTSVNTTIIVDLIAPGIALITNISVERACDQRNITFNTDESANHTIFIDTDTDVADGQIFEISDFVLNHSVIFDFNLNREVDHFINITTCDAAGNCNTASQFTYTTPAAICTGWSQYAVYDGQINLSTIQNQSGADLVYFWNATAQDWVFHTAGISTNGEVIIGEDTDFHVVHLFEDTNSTWYRNLTSPGVYRYNITSLSNFIRIPRLYNFGNLTESFMNGTIQFPSQISNLSGNGVGNGTFFGPYNITSMAGYNNSIQDYVSHIFNFSFNNASFLQPCFERTENPTCMEVAWIASAFNVSWNGSQIYTNWSGV